MRVMSWDKYYSKRKEYSRVTLGYSHNGIELLMSF